MYKLLLVDDEQLQLEALKNFTNWQNMNIEIIETAINGREALEKIPVIKPDLIITDVKMPVMDGIELLKNIRRLYPMIKVIFLSGYDEFKYVKAALDNGVVGYILKPIDRFDLQETINKAISEYEKDKVQIDSLEIYRDRFFENIIFSSMNKIENKSEIPIFIYKNLTQGKYRIALLNLDNVFTFDYKLLNKYPINNIHILIKDYINLYCDSSTLLKINEDLICIILNTTLSPLVDAEILYEKITHNLNYEYDIPVTLAYYPVEVDVTSLKNTYMQVHEAIKKKFYLGKGIVINSNVNELISVEPEFDYTLTIKNLLNYLYEENRNAVYKYIDEYTCYCIKYFISKNTVLLLTFNLIEELYENIIQNDRDLRGVIDEFYLQWDKFIKFDTIYEILAYLRKIIISIENHLLNNDTDTNTQDVSKVISLLEKYYNRNITVTDIAKEVYLSPNYVRTIFKDKMGITIHDYLTNLRIEKAVEYLKDKSLKVQEISLLVGYEKTSHFCSVFNKHKGLTPNEFRKKLL